MQKNGGGIICLMNAETIRNPYSYIRQELIEKLEAYDANIQYIPDAFKNAERQTNVEVALVKIYIPEKKQESEIYSRLKKAKRLNEYTDEERTALTISDFVKATVAQFNVEVAAGVELIREYKAMEPYLKDSFNSKYPYPILKLQMKRGSGYRDELSVNKYLEKVRLKYWEALFANPKFTGKMTSSMRAEYREMVHELKDYDFNEFNINLLIKDINAKLNKSLQDTMLDMFDKLTVQHTYYPECKNNVHYYNGWCSNKAHKINKKVILPCYDVFSMWDKSFYPYKAEAALRDIEKVLDYLDGNMTSHVDLNHVVEQAKNNPKNIHCKYFDVTFYKKGTMHITFTNLELLEKFNIYAAKNRMWLPPDYGKKHYASMTEEEQAVIDEFQGAFAYEKVVKNSGYYLAGINNTLAING